jgi:tetratricopeptide (TPR) repeat protein
MRSTLCGAAAFLLAAFFCGQLFAANEGQEDLDKATEAKLDATTITDLARVIELAESAMKKGLDEQNTEFAKKLLAATLVQRGTVAATAIFKGAPLDPNWPQFRTAALADLEKAVGLDPTQSQAFFLIAQLNLLPEGDEKRAREAIDKSIDIVDDDPTVKAKSFLLRAGMQQEPEKKLADLSEAVRLMPGDAAAMRARAVLLAKMGKLEESLADFDKAIALEPDDSSTYEEKALILSRLNRYEESLAALEKAKQLSPDSITPLATSAQVHMQQEKLDAALEDLNKALTMDPTNVVAMVLRAGVYQQSGEREKALADADRALRLQPNLPLAIRTRALLLAEDQRYEESAKELERLRKLDPKDPLTLKQLVILYGELKQSEKVLQLYDALVAMEPKNWMLLRGRGDAYLNVGKQAEAIADYEAAMAVEPKDHGILNNLAWVLATSPDEKIRNGKRAIELATAACELSEYKLAHILSTLAAAYAETGDFDTAIKWSTKAVEADDGEHGDALKKELESYQAKKPIRELLRDGEPVENP